MGIKDWFKGTPDPMPSGPAVPAGELAQRLLATGGSDRPYTIAPGQYGDLVGVWQVADAHWRQLIGAAGFRFDFIVTLRLDDATKEVRAMQQSRELDWSFGTGQAWYGAKRTVNGVTVKFKGKVLTPEGTYEFVFDAADMTGPMKQCAAASGWTWRSVRHL